MKCLRKRKWCMAVVCLLALAVLVSGAWFFFTKRAQRKEYEAFKQELLQYREAKLEQYRRENATFGPREVEVAFLGDSLTDGYDVAAYYPQYVTVNRGIGGDKTYDLKARLQISAYELQPQVVVMLIGANNMDAMFEDYESILQDLQKNLPETKVVLLSLTAMSGELWGPKNQLAAYNNVTIKLLAQKYGFTFVDIFSVLYDVSLGEINPAYTVDGGHLTAEGYEVITAELTPVLQELLGK